MNRLSGDNEETDTLKTFKVIQEEDWLLAIVSHKAGLKKLSVLS